MVAERTVAQVDIADYQYGFHDKEDYVFKSERGLTREERGRDISEAQIYSLIALYDRPARGRGRDQLPSFQNDH